jgi:phosphatidylserine/phosphatidylglycerophosphate/cardiolipin synthase-like enzyme
VHFLPDVVWLGSANWTAEAEGLHTEAAVAVADRSFVKDATRYVSDIIGQSEAVEWYAPTPRPDLASSQLDMQAFADYAAEFYLDQPGDDLTAPTYGC